MGNLDAIYSIIKEVSIKHNLYKISADSLSNFIKSKVGVGSLNISAQDADNLEEILKALAQQNKITLEYVGNMLNKIVFNDFYIEKIRSIYAAMSKDPHLPFPVPDMFKQTIPTHLLQIVDVKSEFVSFLESPSSDDSKILKLTFPQFEYSLLVLPSMLRTTLLQRAVGKIKTFLDKESNNDYIRSRIIAAMKKDETAVKTLILNIHSNIDKAIDTLMNPTTVSFSFWSHLATSVIKEYQSKKSVYIGDYIYAQAAFLIGYYNVYYKGRSQKNADKESAFKTLKSRLRREPYCFSLRDMYSFVDEKGTEIVKICGKDDFNDYVNKLISEVDSFGLPEVIMVKTEGSRDYFISRDIFALYLFKEIDEATRFFKNEIVMEWKDSLESYTQLEEMRSDSAFEKLLIKKLKSQRPVLLGMLDYKMVTILLSHSSTKEEDKLELHRLVDLDNGQIVSYASILNLNRSSLLNEVKGLVPIYKSNGFLKGFVTFFGKLFGLFSIMKNSKKSNKSVKELDFKKTSSDDFSKAVSKLMEEYVGEDGNIELSMEDLIQKWNPLFDPVKKANLVEDVNAMIRDYLRKIKHSFSVSMPERDRVETMALRLSENSAFEAIKKKEPLRQYMVLYMIDQLSKMRLFK